MRRPVARARSERGAAAVEFALLVPVLCLLLFGIISYGVMLSFRQSMSQAATEGARAAAVTFLTSGKQAAGYEAVNDALGSFGVTCAGGTLKRGTTTVGTCTVSPPGPCTPAASAGVQCVTVSIVYDYAGHPLVPTFGIGLVLPDTLRYSAQARVS